MTVKSAMLGVIDYTKADIHNPGWWKRWRYLLRSLDNHSYVDVQRDAYRFHLALLGSPHTSSKSFGSIQKEAIETFQDIDGSIRPWTGRATREQRQQSMSTEFKKSWQEMTGWSVEDPKAMADWEERLYKHQENVTAAREQEAAKEAEKLQKYRDTVDAVLKRRMQQQGRK